MEAEPRVLELTGEDLHKVSHAYGTNGIITEVEMPLTPAYDWVDVIVGFDDFMRGGRASPTRSAMQDGILVKQIAPIAAPDAARLFPAPPEIPAARQSIVVVRWSRRMRSTRSLAFTRAQQGREIVFRADTAPTRT